MLQLPTCQSRVVGLGSYLPGVGVSNQELIEKRSLESSSDWIVERTGIERRYFASNGETTSDLAIQAAKKALESVSYDANSVDLVILATTTPDHIFPATAANVAHQLGVASCAPAFDIQAVCSGFVFALAMADNMLRLGQANRALIIGADMYSRILDWTDRSTCILFGDGAGAVLLERTTPSKGNTSGIPGVIGHKLNSDGKHYHDLYVAPRPHLADERSCVIMDGKKVFRHAVERMSSVLEQLLMTHGLQTADLDLVVPHQANIRIIHAVAQRLKVDPSIVISTIQHHGNISAASIPVAMAMAYQQGRIKSDMLLGLTALGGGFSWGGALLRWG